MTLFLLLSAARAADPEPVDAVDAGALVVDAHVPVEILVNGVKLGQLYVPGESRFQIVAGRHRVRVYTNGNPTDLEVEIVKDQEARVLVGRTGVTSSSGPMADPDPADAVAVEFRVVGTPGAQVRLDDGRHAVRSGAAFKVDVSPGSHPLSVRSEDGTAIWASGTLEVTGSPVVVQIAEGRVPEVSGSASFRPGGG